MEMPLLMWFAGMMRLADHFPSNAACKAMIKEKSLEIWTLNAMESE